MLKKIIIGTLVVILVGAAGVAAYDAVQGNSTLDLPSVDSLQNIVSQAQGPGQGQGRQGQGQGRDQQGQGQGQGRGRQGQDQGRGNGQGNVEMMDREWQTVPGTIVSVEPQSLTVDTADMGPLTLQLGRIGFADAQNVTFAPGDAVTILGFTGENGTFEAGQITNQATGAALQLRDPNGRPLWAGPGQRQGQGDQQSRQGGQAGRQDNGMPQAANQEWITLSGKVVAGNQQGVTVDTVEMGEVVLEMGPPWFSGEQGVDFNVGDAVTVLGFAGEGTRFQSGEITNQTTGQTLFLRDPNGRPLWAGRGQGGGAGQGHGQNSGG